MSNWPLMRTTRLCLVYGVVALLALFGTWSQNLHYLNGFGAFLDDAKANPAARSVTIDIILVAVAASFFMVFEARRLGIRFVWAYVLFGVTVAISVTFPLFLIAREVRLAARQTGDVTTEGLATLDIVGFAVLCALAAGLCWFTLLT